MLNPGLHNAFIFQSKLIHYRQEQGYFKFCDCEANVSGLNDQTDNITLYVISCIDALYCTF